MSAQPVLFMFNGQGSQKVKMGLDLVKKYGHFKDFFNRASEIYKEDLFSVWQQGPATKLKETHFSQPIVTIFNIGVYHILKNHITPAAVAGHSLGELSALYGAAAITFEDLFRLIHIRANAMSRAAAANPGSMYALIGYSLEKIKTLIKDSGLEIDIANYNNPEQIVISGATDQVKDFINEVLKEHKIKKVPLSVSGAWHSRLMESAARELETTLENISINRPALPVYFNATASLETDPEKIKKLLVRQLTTTVQWVALIESVYDKGLRDFVCCGVGKVLKGFILKTLKTRQYNCASIETLRDIEKLLKK